MSRRGARGVAGRVPWHPVPPDPVRAEDPDVVCPRRSRSKGMLRWREVNNRGRGRVGKVFRFAADAPQGKGGTGVQTPVPLVFAANDKPTLSPPPRTVS